MKIDYNPREKTVTRSRYITVSLLLQRTSLM